MKRAIALFCLFVVLLTSCREDTTQLAKDEFAKYHNGKNEVVLCIWTDLYFEDHLLRSEDFHSQILYGSFAFYEGSVYYMSLDNTDGGSKNKRITVYSCDFHGNNTQKVYSKELNTRKNVKVKTSGDSYYIKYVEDGVSVLDKYTISTDLYENLFRGEECNLTDYVPEEKLRYNVEMIKNLSPQEHGKFVITDTETGAKKTIDDDYLSDTIYIESMEMFNFGPQRADISNGRILLTYGIGAGDGWNYPHLVFEYDFESDTLEYKLLAFPYDSVPIEIVYIA